MPNKEVNYGLKVSIILFIFNMFNVKSFHQKQPGIIYMLLWTEKAREPFRFWPRKRKAFTSMNCEYQNCFIVHDSDYFEDVTDYDAILFNPLGISEYLPMARSDNQIYVFVALEPSAYLPLEDKWNYFYNITWTYKLNSDVTYPYFIVRNKRGQVVGPKIDAHWIKAKNMRPAPKSVIERLENKTTAVAFFVTNCGNHKRLGYAHKLHNILLNDNLLVDIYGGCGNKVCLREKYEECLYLVEQYYYFYLAFENSYCEDYVTEKLMTALDHYTVPIVLGGANYTRFMPDGIYLNAETLSEEELAVKIKEAVQDKQKYYDYFRWHRYYTYQFSAESRDSDPLCQFCAYLNDESKRSQRRVYSGFTKWWNDYSKPNDTDNIIERYEDSDPHFKSYISFRDKLPVKVSATASAFQEIGSFVGDVYHYYFEK